jgi:hypothetical protein
MHDYYPSAMEDEGRLDPMAVGLVDRMTILVVVRRLMVWVLLFSTLCIPTNILA